MIQQEGRYFFDQAAEQERSRLSGLSAVFDPVTFRHLTSVGVGSGWRCLEVGAGAGSVAAWLSTTVGPDGRVTATDLDVRFLDDLGDNVEVVRHDVTSDPLEQDAFDLVHARAVVEHLPARDEVIGRLVSALHPGGVLMLEDFVFGGAASEAVEAAVDPPASGPAMTRVLAAMSAAFRAVGADSHYGLQLPMALAAAGLQHVNAELTLRLLEGGSPQAAFYSQTLSERATQLVELGLLSPADAEHTKTFVDDPASRWLSLGVLTSWGRRP
jgi:2-polyprenyl-3-methyl-5-hydroxy-6-metoxy-1,4-benzoquinol methylase